MTAPTKYDPALLNELKGSLAASECLEARMSEFQPPFAALLRAKIQRLYFGAYTSRLPAPWPGSPWSRLPCARSQRKACGRCCSSWPARPSRSRSLRAFAARLSRGSRARRAACTPAAKLPLYRRGPIPPRRRGSAAAGLERPKTAEWAFFWPARRRPALLGLAGHDLCIPENWLGEGHAQLRSACGSRRAKSLRQKTR
jgi:hypothetical protein